MLLAFVINGGISYSQNEGMKSKNATQDVEIKNTNANFTRIEKALASQHLEQTAVNNKILDKLDDLNDYMREHNH